MRKWINKLLPSQARPVQSPVAGAHHRQQGDSHLQSGDFAAAARCYRQAIAANPADAKAHCKLGFSLKELGQTGEARQHLEQALALEPNNADAHYLLGTLEQAEGQAEAALAHFRNALAAEPALESAYVDAGLLLAQMGQLEQARQLLADGTHHVPSSAPLHFYLGNVLHELMQLESAATAFRQTLALQPDFAQAWGNLGIVLFKNDEPAPAIDALQQAIALNPGYIDAYNNLGNALLQFNRTDDAMATYQQGLAAAPDSARLHYNRGLLSLLLGDFGPGWQDYEYRQYQTEQSTPRQFSEPLWLNDSDITGRTILLHAEQGIGDSLQFCRYVEQVVALGASVHLDVHPPLKSLLQTLPGVAAVTAMGEPLPHFDYHCPLASLPLAFHRNGGTIPARVPYLQAPQERVAHWENQLRTQLKDATRPRIGVVWAGGLHFKNDRFRSIALQTFAPLFGEEKYQFLSLQKDLRAGDAALLEGFMALAQPGPQLSDFADTAALVANLDLIISVDTAVAHLAGAMAKPVWVLLPYAPDFRWQLDRDDSPWYPTARLFRQPARGDWQSVVLALRAALGVHFGR